jgi:acyl-CoA thioester hydrolase
MKIHQIQLAVSQHDIDELGHVNNVTYLRFVQEAAKAHWESTATPEQLSRFCWVALRHEIDYLKPAFLHDELMARTHVAAFEGVRSIRVVEISHETKILCRCITQWCMLDATTMRPMRVPQEIVNLYI